MSTHNRKKQKRIGDEQEKKKKRRKEPDLILFMSLGIIDKKKRKDDVHKVLHHLWHWIFSLVLTILRRNYKCNINSYWAVIFNCEMTSSYIDPIFPANLKHANKSGMSSTENGPEERSPQVVIFSEFGWNLLLFSDPSHWDILIEYIQSDFIK